MNEGLAAQSLKGIWAGPPVFWDERYRLDEDTQVENWKRTCALKPHGCAHRTSDGRRKRSKRSASGCENGTTFSTFHSARLRPSNLACV